MAIGRTDFVLLREVADCLMSRPDLMCGLVVDLDHHALRVTVEVAASGDSALNVIELAQELDYLAGVGTVRAFAEHYGIPSGPLDAMLQKPPSE